MYWRLITFISVAPAWRGLFWVWGNSGAKRKIIDLYDLYDLYDLLQMPLFAATFRNPMFAAWRLDAAASYIEADVSAVSAVSAKSSFKAAAAA